MEQDDEDVDQVENVLPFAIGIEVTLRVSSPPPAPPEGPFVPACVT